jgi:ADP-ribosylglycohydrolase
MSSPALPAGHDERLARAYLSLDGLSIGDSLGSEFCWREDCLSARRLPEAPWRWTDDTEMALSIVYVLRRFGHIEQDELAHSFAAHFNTGRMYGPAMYHELLPRLRHGEDWRNAARELFHGSGSLGNGAAMRVAPLGAYFGDDLSRVADEAKRSAEVTHAHPEGVAGAVAVALAAARAWQLRASVPPNTPGEFIEPILELIPESRVRREAAVACRVPPDVSPEEAARMLGNGSRVTAQDTVPFALWSAARHLGDYQRAAWSTATAYGDIDTNCAIVGGIVALYVGRDGLPNEWLRRREPLPHWPFLYDE